MFGAWRTRDFNSWLTLAVSRLSYKEAMGAVAVYLYTSFFYSSVLFNARHFFKDMIVDWLEVEFIMGVGYILMSHRNGKSPRTLQKP